MYTLVRLAAEYSPPPMSPRLQARYQPIPLEYRPYSPTDPVDDMSDVEYPAVMESDSSDDEEMADSPVELSDISMYDFDPEDDNGWFP